MESEISQLWGLVKWGFGLSFTGFCLLAGWMWWLVGRIKLKDDIVTNMETMSKSLKAIEIALVGDFDKKGLITRVHEIENNCERQRHPK